MHVWGLFLSIGTVFTPLGIISHAWDSQQRDFFVYSCRDHWMWPWLQKKVILMGGYMIPQLYVPPMPGIHFVGPASPMVYPAYPWAQQVPGYNLHYSLPPGYYPPAAYPASGRVYPPNCQPALNTQPPQTPTPHPTFPKEKRARLKSLEKLRAFRQGANITFLPALLMGTLTFLCQSNPFANKAVLKNGLKKSALWTILFIAVGGYANLLQTSPNSWLQRMKQSIKQPPTKG